MSKAAGTPPTVGPFARPLGGGPRRSGRFYDGTPGHTTVPCPDCSKPADALFGDHGGSCIGTVSFAPPRSALGIIRAHALRLRRFSMNDLRAAFDEADIPPTSRGPAFGAAVRKGWIEDDGAVRSIAKRTKGHRIQVYLSCIHPDGIAADAARDKR